MIYGSLCSGIESATVAWESLGWRPAWFSEIEEFPKAVLKHRYPNVPDLGDMTRIYENEIFKQSKIDLLVGGTPCQSFSLGGKRAGLDDPRGNLALEFLKIASIKNPRWIVWENVSGVLSSYSGPGTPSQVDEELRKESECEVVEAPDFEDFIRGLQELRYGFAWRVLDAQFFGVPQQRRRLFVVAHSSGDYRYPTAVLFDSQAFDYDRQGGNPETRSIPILTTTTAGNSNARGVVIIEKDISRTIGDRFIRSLTPEEEERRQGFPGNHTNIPWGSGLAPDSLRYKAIGNSMAIPVMRWIGERIQFMEETEMGTRTVTEKTCSKCNATYKADRGNKHATGACVGVGAVVAPQIEVTTQPKKHTLIIQIVKDQLNKLRGEVKQLEDGLKELEQ